MLIKEALRFAEEELLKIGIIPYKFEAKELVALALKTEPQKLRLMAEEAFPPRFAELLEEYISRRANGEPLQYIIGYWEFYSLPFKVGQGVLIPRADTELLVDNALEFLRGKDGAEVADLCSGSGCIAISIAKNRPDCRVSAYELSDEALDYLQYNKALNEVELEIIKQDITANIPCKKFDLIVSNPPYIETFAIPDLDKELSFEPNMALDGGDDGLKFYRTITENWVTNLKKGGALMVEVGINQHTAVARLFREAGLRDVKWICDINGIERVIIGTLPI